MSLLDLVLNSKDPKKKLNLKPQYRTAAELAGASNYIPPTDNTRIPTVYTTGVNYPNVKEEIVINPWTKNEMFNKRLYGVNWDNRENNTYHNTTSTYQNPYSPYNLPRENWIDVLDMSLEATPGIGEAYDISKSTLELALKGDPTALMYSMLGLAVPFLGGAAVGKIIDKIGMPDSIYDFVDNTKDIYKYVTNPLTKKGRFANQYSDLFNNHLKNRGIENYFTKSTYEDDLLKTTLFDKYGDSKGNWEMGLNDKALEKIAKQDWSIPNFPDNSTDPFDKIPILTMINTSTTGLPPQSGLYSQSFMDNIKNTFGFRVGAGRNGQTLTENLSSGKIGSHNIWEKKVREGRAYSPSPTEFTKAISFSVLPPLLLRALQRDDK